MSTAISEAIELPVGHVFEIGFDLFRPRVEFLSDTQLKFDILEGLTEGANEVVEYKAINLRQGLFVVSWQEKSTATVVHVEDFAKGEVHAHITMPDNTFMRITGPIEEPTG